MRFRIAGGYTPFAPMSLATDPLIQGFLRNSAPPLSVYRLRAYLLRTDTRIVLVQPSSRGWLEIVRAATRVRPRLTAGTYVFAVDTRRVRSLLVRPRIPVHARGGFALSPRATPVASLSAASDSRLAVAAWLTWDWRTRHVIVQASTRTGAWVPAETLSDRGVEASKLDVAVGGRRAIVSWIEAHHGVAILRVAEYRRGHWHRIHLPQNAAAAMQASVAAAGDGTAAVAWTVQADARLVLRAARINGRGRPSAVRDLSSPPHSVEAFTVTAGTRRLAVAWRERDSTSSSLLVATLPVGARTWSQPTVVATGAELGTPIVRDGRFGPVVVWTSHGSTGAGLHAARVDRRGQAGRPLALVMPRGAQRIAIPGVTPTADGVLVAWCAATFQRAALRVALITAAGVHPGARSLASCSGTSPHLLRVGNRIVVNVSRVPRLYALTRRLRCTRMDAVDTAGAYRLVASSLGIDAVSAAGSANGTVAVRGLAWPERDDPPC